MANIERIFNGRVIQRINVRQNDAVEHPARVSVEITRFPSPEAPPALRHITANLRHITLTGDEVASLFNNAIPGLKVEYTEPPKPLPQHIGAVIVVPAAYNEDEVMLTRYRRGSAAPAWTSENGVMFTDTNIMNVLEARVVQWRPATPEETDATLVEEAVTE